MRAGLPAKMFGVGGRQERALVVVEPPRHLRGIRILEVHDYIFIAVKQARFPRLRGVVRHPQETKLGILIKLFPEKAVKESGGSRAIKAAIVETKPDLGHK
jgi:hypothetical protein